MSKTIQSPVSRFPGHVVLTDPLTLVQTLAWEAAVENIVNLGEGTSQRKQYAELLPCVCDFVERWELDGIPPDVMPDTFPGTPTQPVAELLAWLVGEIGQLFADGENVPNAS